MSAEGPSSRLGSLPYDEDALIYAWQACAKTGSDERLERLANQFEQLGDELEFRGDFPGSLRNFDRTHDIREELTRRDAASAPRKRDLSITLTRRGRVHRKVGDLEAAAANFQGAVTLRRWLVERQPRDAAYKSDLARAEKKLREVEEEQQVVAQMAKRDAQGVCDGSAHTDAEHDPRTACTRGLKAQMIDSAVNAGPSEIARARPAESARAQAGVRRRL